MHRSHAPSDLDRLLGTAAALSAAIQAMPSRPFYDLVPRAAARRDGRRWLTRASDVVLSWHERGRQRRQLITLSDDALRDIGITRSEALGEALKPVWRA